MKQEKPAFTSTVARGDWSYLPDYIWDIAQIRGKTAFVVACFLFSHLDCARGEITFCSKRELARRINRNVSSTSRALAKLVAAGYFTLKFSEGYWRVRCTRPAPDDFRPASDDAEFLDRYFGAQKTAATA